MFYHRHIMFAITILLVWDKVERTVYSVGVSNCIYCTVQQNSFSLPMHLRDSKCPEFGQKRSSVKYLSCMASASCSVIPPYLASFFLSAILFRFLSNSSSFFLLLSISSPCVILFLIASFFLALPFSAFLPSPYILPSPYLFVLLISSFSLSLQIPNFP